ncbi:hypothetical protein H5410_064283 [Solanum commersonii]|uniref:Uncharacterized protein n=1 Tax=Solanum commersonii TaxID=4109 RepID=A0A9J5W032_SOLCO|nr:hypothetical protein H5410_064283 [Solanum commersonii]
MPIPSNCLPIKDIHTSFINKIFSIRAKKAFACTSNATAAKLYIESCVEKKNTLPAPNTTNIRKQQVELEQSVNGVESSSIQMKQKLEPPTPEKSIWRKYKITAPGHFC